MGCWEPTSSEFTLNHQSTLTWEKTLRFLVPKLRVARVTCHHMEAATALARLGFAR